MWLVIFLSIQQIVNIQYFILGGAAVSCSYKRFPLIETIFRPLYSMSSDLSLILHCYSLQSSIICPEHLSQSFRYSC